MDFIYRILVTALPFLFSFLGYYVVIRKIRHVPQPAVRVLAYLLAAGGLVYTFWQLFVTYANLDDERFNFVVLIANVVILAIISIVMAIAEPERK